LGLYTAYIGQSDNTEFIHSYIHSFICSASNKHTLKHSLLQDELDSFVYIIEPTQISILLFRNTAPSKEIAYNNVCFAMSLFRFPCSFAHDQQYVETLHPGRQASPFVTGYV